MFPVLNRSTLLPNVLKYFILQYETIKSHSPKIGHGTKELPLYYRIEFVDLGSIWFAAFCTQNSQKTHNFLFFGLYYGNSEPRKWLAPGVSHFLGFMGFVEFWYLFPPRSTITTTCICFGKFCAHSGLRKSWRTQNVA